MSSGASVVPISIITGEQWTPLKVGDTVYKQAPLTLAQMGELESWIKSQFPDPIETAKKMAEGLPLELARDVIARGQEQALNPRWCLGTASAGQVLRSMSGMVEMLSLQLKKHHPELTRDDIVRIVETVYAEAEEEGDTPEDVAEKAQAVAFCHDPSDITAESLADPKAETSTA